jgi:hypothetical protein
MLVHGDAVFITVLGAGSVSWSRGSLCRVVIPPRDVALFVLPSRDIALVVGLIC